MTMTNERVCASGEARSIAAESDNMTSSPNQMTRVQMQTESMIVESLIGTALAFFSCPDPSDAIYLLDMAHQRARRLNEALDNVNEPEAVA